MAKRPAATSKRLVVNDKEFQAKINSLIKKGGNLSKPLLQFRQYMVQQTDSMWEMLSQGGGTHRSKRWKPFAPQYTRKTDGVTVPAHGGVPKIKGQGMVQGRLRPTRTRVTAASALMDDSGNLRGKAASAVFRQTKHALTFGTPKSVNYADRQNQLRPYLFFFKKKDEPMLVKIVSAYLNKD
tara:strand:+ start:22861 stop:23406 length:546 start_codon:yes stop_codon:yes gene_type:complete